MLAFLNEVAGGRKLLTACRELADAGADYFAVVAPQNLPIVGQLVDVEERRDAAQSRVDVTQAVLREFGIASEGAVMDPDPSLALDDAVRATQPDYILLSCLYETRFGLMRKDLVEWAKARYDRVEHIPVRVDDDAVRWDSPTPWSSRPRPSTARTSSTGCEQRAKEQAAPLHVHLPALRRHQPRGDLPPGSPRPSPSSTATRSTRPASR